MKKRNIATIMLLLSVLMSLFSCTDTDQSDATVQTETDEQTDTITEQVVVMNGIPIKEYHCADYTEKTENDYAKIEGAGSSLTLDNIDGGDGGRTGFSVTYCSEPNYETEFEIEVNGEIQLTFKNNGGSAWFEMRRQSGKITLLPGADNVIRIITPNGRVTHFASVSIGDYSENDVLVKRANQNKKTYSFMDADPAVSEQNGGKTYAKLGVSDKITLTGIDGGEKGGIAAAYVRTTTQPNTPTTLSIKVNDDRAIVVPVPDMSSGWFVFFDTGFETFLTPGKTNTVSVQILSGGITHLDTLVVGPANGAKTNPFSASSGELIGETDAKTNAANEFLISAGMIDHARGLSDNCLSALTKLSDKETAKELFNKYTDGNVITQRQYLSMLLTVSGHDVALQNAVKTAEARGIVKNVRTSSYGDEPLDFDTLCAYTYNALSANCIDGKALSEKCGIKIDAPEKYQLGFEVNNKDSTADINNVVAVSKNGVSGVNTKAAYGRYTLTADVKSDGKNSFVMGFRVRSSVHGMYDSGLWLSLNEKIFELSSGGNTVRMETPTGLFDITDGARIKAVDSGKAINLFSVTGDAEIPLVEIRFTDGYAVGYVRGHIIQGIKADDIDDTGHISFSAKNGTVKYKNIVITGADAYQNPVSDFPADPEGKPFEMLETFDEGIYDYNAFYGTGTGIRLKNEALKFETGNENVFSTVMRVDNAVFEADVLSLSGSVKFQLAASSPMSTGDYYKGLCFEVSSSSVALTHGVGNHDAEAEKDSVIRSHGIKTANGFSVRITDTDSAITLEIKEPSDDYKTVMRIVKVNGYLSVLNKDENKEEAHFDKLARDFGFLRIASSSAVSISKIYISGEAYLPLEQMELKTAPRPDANKVLDADNVETLVGVGYIPYFGRYKVNGNNAVRPAVEDLLPDVLQALKLKGAERTKALDKLYWGYAWWATPVQGMYCGRDFAAAKTNLQMIAEAGIDFIYIDNTNFNAGCSPDYIISNMQVILDAVLELEAEGKPYPKICFWNNVRNENRGGFEDTAREIWQFFICNEKYKNLWVYYHGKPLMLYTFNQPSPYVGMGKVAEIREMWTTSNVKNTWSFHQDPPEMSDRGGYDKDGNLEQINVLPYGKTTFRGNISELANVVNNGKGGREGGLYYKKYWEKAFETRPKFVTLWAYNHWDVAFNKPSADGSVYWGDNFSQEYSGGLEPIAGTFEYDGKKYPGDSYYNWTKQYIEAYKAGEKMPEDLYVK